MARKPRELEQRPAVDPHEDPSAEWGWHGSFHRGKIIAGALSALLLVVFIFGPYQNYTHALWLGGIALAIAFMIWRSVVARRNAWRR